MNQNKTQKKQPAENWHRADIVAALHKKGLSLRGLAVKAGYKSESTLSKALNAPWPKGERIIAEALGVAPETIWPTRYDKDGKTNRRRGVSFTAAA